MSLSDEMKSADGIWQKMIYIMMGLSLLFPILLYALTRSVFRWFLNMESMSIALLFLLLSMNLGILVYLHVKDYRNLKRVCENTDKLLATLLAFQPAYFWMRQKTLGKPTKGAVVYAVISTLELVGMVSVYAVACIGDVLKML